jgi:phosphatidylinositol phospholipase C beta
MAQYLVDIFGNNLITEPLKTHPCEENSPLPSPNDLKYKILIKNKKLHTHPTPKVNNQNIQRPRTITATSSSELSADISTVSSSPTQSYFTTSSDGSFRRQQAVNSNPRRCLVFDDEDSSDDDRPNPIELQTPNSDAVPESKPTKALSDLVHYTVPINFTTFARAEELNRHYEMSSFSEEKAQNLIRDYAKDFLAYNQRQISRIYPRGTRLDSRNFNPYIFWPIGCQMVALNYQTLGEKQNTLNN